MTAVVTSSARDKFVSEVLSHLGKTVLMGQLDCSELVALGHLAAGVGDQRLTHTAQRYHDETRPLLIEERPLPGDLGFYGDSPKRVIHVIIFTPSGVLSADGATRRITDIEVARAKRAVVRLHPSPNYRDDVPWRGWHRNVFLDRIDLASR